MQAFSGSHEAAEEWRKVRCSSIDYDGLKMARLSPAIKRTLTDSYSVTENLQKLKAFI